MNRKRVLLASALAGVSLVSVSLATAASAHAQDTAQPPATEVGEIIATGTRLRLPDYVLPNPVISVGEQKIEQSGEANVTDFLTDIPALSGSLNDVTAADQSTAQTVGLNLLDLRNLGNVRTLVLVNGRRHVAGDPGSAAVDVNTIPSGLIQRVDVLTGGASAVYGADGVSGVVNFILKEDYEGLSTRAQYGWSQEGGGATTSGDVLFGRNFGAGRGNITLNAEYYQREDVKYNQRSYTRPGSRFIPVNNPAEVAVPGDDPNIFDTILTNDARYIDTSPEGSIITRNDYAYRYLGTGAPFVDGLNTASFITIGGSGSRLDDYNDDLYPGQDRYSFNATGHWDFTDKVRVFGEMKYVQTNTDFEGQPTYDYGLFIPIDNPFIPTVARNDFFAAQGTGDDVASDLGFPDGILVSRDNFDLGRIQQKNKRETFRSVFGAKGSLSDNLNYEASWVHGESKQRITTDNVRINDRFFAAIDVVETSPGNYACRSNVTPGAVPYGDIFAQFPLSPSDFGTTFTPGPGSGCIPINIFGTGNASQAALDWINTSVTDKAKITQDVVNAYISGSTDDWFKIPTGGGISFVLGAEYRRESSTFTPDALRLQAASQHYPVTFLGEAAVTTGSFNVAEAFTELSLPLLLDKPLAKEFTLTGAYRYSDYSTSGGSDTWNAGFRWRPSSVVMFRGTIARAVRAPNISDLFSGAQQTFESFSDPCDDNNRSLGDNPTLRATNCAAAINAITPGNPSYTDTSSEATAGVISGNPALNPETADTVTYGIVITPSSLIPGLQVSADFYNVSITDAIRSYSAQTIINNCYDLPQPNNFCSLLTRQGAGDPFPGRLESFIQIPGNIASYRTSGIDFTVRYALDPHWLGIRKDIGDFNFSVIGNKLRSLVFIESSGAPVIPSLGNLGAPEWTVNFDATWNYHDWSVTYGYNYFSTTRRYSLATERARPTYTDPRYWKYGERNEHDIQVSWKPSKKYTVYGGINNFTNAKPEFQDYNYPVSPLGRFFYVGLKTNLK